MSTVLQCDRCGAILKGEISHTGINYKYKFDGQERYNYYDLCGSCGKSFIQWLEKENSAKVSKVATKKTEKKNKEK